MNDTLDGAQMPLLARFGRALALSLLWIALALLTLWAAAALYIDCRIRWLRLSVTIVYLAVVAVILWKVSGWWKPALVFGGFCVVLAWWLTLKPTNDADWQPNVARTAQIEIAGDRVTIHNFRNCDYRTEQDYTNCWGDREFNLGQLRALDFFLINWGIPYISHTIVSFDFGDNQHVAFSIEARYQRGQEYSALRGFFRQFELTVVVAAETDVIRLRTNFRKDEKVYLYRTRATPETARAVFVTYAGLVNRLHDRPQWYNALTRNCTTAIDHQIAPNVGNQRGDYRIVLSGALDRLLYERGGLVTGGLPFASLKQQAHINPVAHTVSDIADYSAAIRRGRVGF